MAEPIVIRPSSVGTYLDCPRRFAARHLADLLAQAGYEVRALPRVHVGAAVGSGVHAAAAYTLTTKRDTGAIGSDSEAEDRAITEFNGRVEHGVDWDDTTRDLGTAKRQIARMSRSYRRHLAPGLTPLLVEERLDADIGDGWAVSGQLDTLSGDADGTIADLKTGVRRRAHATQYALYRLLFQAHGYSVRALREWFVPRVRIEREQPLPTTADIDLAPATIDAWEAIEGIKRDTQAFLDRAANPSGRSPIAAFRPNPASSLCAARWCPAHSTPACRAHL